MRAASRQGCRRFCRYAGYQALAEARTACLKVSPTRCKSTTSIFGNTGSSFQVCLNPAQRCKRNGDRGVNTNVVVRAWGMLASGAGPKEKNPDVRGMAQMRCDNVHYSTLQLGLCHSMGSRLPEVRVRWHLQVHPEYGNPVHSATLCP